MYYNRDMGINYIKTRKNHVCYGMGIGIMVLEGVDNHALVWEQDKSPCRTPILRAARKLERMGCRAIAAECGYFAYFQKDVAGYVDVPVFMSSLLQVPFIQQIIGPKKQVGIVCAQKRFLTEDHLKNVGIDPDSNIVIAGAQDEYYCREFDNLWDPEKRPDCPEVFYDKAEEQMIRTCVDFVGANSGIGAVMLECTGMQPFARAVQCALDLPVFSWGTLLDYAFSVVTHRDYYGHV